MGSTQGVVPHIIHGIARAHVAVHISHPEILHIKILTLLCYMYSAT